MASLPNGDIVLFGGNDQNGPRNDTWRCNQGTWVQLSPPFSPPGIGNRGMAYDPADGSLVLINGSSTPAETWRLQGGNWSLLPATAPAGTILALFTDTVRGDVCVASTAGAILHFHALRNGAWTQLSEHPAMVTTAVGAFDSERGRYVMASLTSGQTITYEWDGLNLYTSGVTQPLIIVVPALAQAAFDARRKEVVMTTFLGGGSMRRWSAAPHPFATAYGVPCQDQAFTLNLAPGDSPEVGASHRIQAAATNGNAAVLSMLGLSHVTDGGLPLPRPINFGTLACLQRVQALSTQLLGGMVPTTVVSVPNSTNLIGVRYDAQFLAFDLNGVLDTTNGLEVQIGRPALEQELIETFASSTRRDALASGDQWFAGQTQPVMLGGNGEHGSFDLTLGRAMTPDHYVFDTDSLVIPAANTLSGVDITVTNGQFFFTDFVVPAGKTVSFVGNTPAQIRVRGRVDIQGTLSADGQELPFWIPTNGPAFGQRVSAFDARGAAGTPLPFVTGQPGSRGGPGGGRGGAGGDECQGTGPIVVGSITVTDGQPGQDARVAAGHAYAARMASTGGRGSAMNPPTGIAQPNQPLIPPIYRSFFSPGGGGGGFSTPGGVATLTPLPNAQVGPIPSGGTGFSLMPYPPAILPNPGYSSLDHFLVGGSGGGGGGSHAFGTLAVANLDVYMAGSGGSGGGGAMVLRAGGDLVVGTAANITARGGAGVLITGDNANSPSPDQTWGLSSPGGGGSGGSVLLQSAANLAVAGNLDTSGGSGSRTGYSSNPQADQASQAGAGATGFVRLEAASNLTFNGTSVPTLVGGVHSGPLTDRDAKTGSRSTWLMPATAALPVYLRYELIADVGGSTVLFSDDASISPMRADDPNGPVVVRFQGARLDPATGQPNPATIGPWRAQVVRGDASSLNRDRANLVRFDLVLNKANGPVVVRELRIVWK